MTLWPSWQAIDTLCMLFEIITSMNRTPDIELTEEETELLSQIAFGSVNHEQLRSSLEPMAKLSESLIARDAIPNPRIRYFTDPDWNPSGRGKSRQDIFIKNGTSGRSILNHPHFMKYLEYFIYGPNLPKSTVISFYEASQFGGNLSNSDMHELLPAAKAIVRSRGMDVNTAADEFYKLALECGAISSTAESLRNTIRKMKKSR